jgi:hypothetical protein
VVSRRADVLLALTAALLAAAALLVGARFTRPLLVELGPNDSRYAVQGFREDWERDRATRFRWTSLASEVAIPAKLSGPGFVLRARMRRHFTEPAHVRMASEGRIVGSFDVGGDPKVAYHVVEVPLPELAGRAPFALTLDVSSSNPRPLGVALDWLSVERSGRARVTPLAGSLLRAALVALALFVALRVAGATRAAAAAAPALFAMAVGLGSAVDYVAAERMLHEGSAAFVVAAAVAAAIVRGAYAADLTPPVRAALLGVVLAGLLLRLAVLLHPQFYYPDVRIHAVFAHQVARRGVSEFLSSYIASQFQYSLGLQNEGGHWYAFPYPPGFYLLCWPMLRAGFRAEVAVSVMAGVINGLTVLGVFALARVLKLSAWTGVAAAVASALLPLYFVRLTLAYFPALSGHAIDLVVLLFLLQRASRAWATRDGLAFSALMAVAMLAYVQTILNFAVVLGPYLLLDAWRDRAGRSRQLWIAAGCVLGGVIALGLFYHRYIGPVMDMRAGRPMAGESIVLERLEREARATAAVNEPVEPEEVDPYSGPDTDLGRGVRKAAWRMWVFYGPFSAAVIAGLLLVLRRTADSNVARLLACWAAAYVILNLLSGGLPGPNLVRYNKDHELVAPLFCVGLAAVGSWLWERGRSGQAGAAVYGLGYLVYGVNRAVAALTARFSLER